MSAAVLRKIHTRTCIPPYHPGNPGHRLVVMSSPEKLTPDAYERFYRFLLDTVMKHAY